jgi:MFS family permease
MAALRLTSLSTRRPGNGAYSQAGSRLRRPWGSFWPWVVILTCRGIFPEQTFIDWGWRIPFLVSIILLIISVYIRLKLQETPVFAELKARGKASKTPLRDSFLRQPNARYVWLALLGATAGQGVVWYTGQFQALFFLQNILKVDFRTAYSVIGISLLIGTPFFIFFGWLSDKIGRKPIIMGGCLLAALTYMPLFRGLTHFANPALEAARDKAPVVLYTNEFHGFGEKMAATISDAFTLYKPSADKLPSYKARQYLIKRGVPFEVQQEKPDGPLVLAVGDKTISGFDEKAYEAAVTDAGYPKAAKPESVNTAGVILILVIMVIYVTMVYGPIAAFLVELFPTQIRYTSMSFPYHIGNGWFGGFLPLIIGAITSSHRKYLCRFVVPDLRGSYDLHYRDIPDSRNQGPRYPGNRIAEIGAPPACRCPSTAARSFGRNFR